MREIPILFNANMVRAILVGRKIQTRRPLKGIKPSYLFTELSQDLGYSASLGRNWAGFVHPTQSSPSPFYYKMPFGLPGDLLWVREPALFWLKTKTMMKSHVAAFKADGYELESGEQWTPSIHMPRWASRIGLRVKRAWVERLRDISEEDAWKEGVEGRGITRYERESIDLFKGVWDPIYEKKGFGWDANPWVACCEFEMEEKV